MVTISIPAIKLAKTVAVLADDDVFVVNDKSDTTDSTDGSTGGVTALVIRTATQADYSINLKTFSLPATTTISAYGAGLVAAIAATNARSTLGLTIGTNVQAYAAALDTVTGTNTGDEAAASTSVAGVAAYATAAEYRAKAANKTLTGSQVYAAAAEVTLTDATTIALDLSTYLNGTVTLGGNRTLGNPTNPIAGQSGYIRVVQDATGSRTLAYGTNYEFAGGTAPTLTTTAAAQDMLIYTVISTTRILISSVLDIK